VSEIFNLNEATIDIYEVVVGTYGSSTTFLFGDIYTQGLLASKTITSSEEEQYGNDDKEVEDENVSYEFSIGQLYLAKSREFNLCVRDKKYEIKVYFENEVTGQLDTYTIENALCTLWSIAGQDNDNVKVNVEFKPSKIS